MDGPLREIADADEPVDDGAEERKQRDPGKHQSIL
jgi:hypothetical protein